MADNSKFEWTDATWNPITGCFVVSPGSINWCAMRLDDTRLQHRPSREGLTSTVNGYPVWNGQVRLDPEWLGLPLAWKRPRRIFVYVHGDLFAESLSDEIDQVFAIIDLATHIERAKATIAHPVLKEHAGTAQRIPGPESKSEGSSICPLAGIETVSLPCGGDCEGELAEHALRRAEARLSAMEPHVLATWVPPGQDFNDWAKIAA